MGWNISGMNQPKQVIDFFESEDSLLSLFEIFKNYLPKNLIESHQEYLQSIIFKRAELIGITSFQQYQKRIVDDANELAVIELIAFQAGICFENNELYKAELEKNNAAIKHAQILHSNSEDAVVMFSSEGKIIYSCATASKILGYTESELATLNLFELIHPDTVEEVSQSMKQSFENPGVTIKGHLCKVKHKNGEWRWLEANVTNLLHDADINGIVDNFRDVTERVEAEIKNKLLEKLLKKAEAIANIGSIEVDFVKDIRIWSDAFYEIFELDRDSYQPTSAGILPFIHPKDKDRYVEWISTGIRNQIASQQIEVNIITAKGNERTVICYSVAEYNADGLPINSFGVIKDITEQKRIEKDLSINKQVYESLFHYNISAVFSLDLDGNLTSANEVLAEKTEMPIEEICKLHYSYFTHPDYLALVNANFKKAKQGESIEYEIKVITATGNILDIYLINIPIIVDGEIIGVFGIANDITVSKNAQLFLEKTIRDKQEILDSSLDIICTVNNKGEFVEINKASESIWGYSPEELIGIPYASLIYHEDIDESIEIGERLFKGENVLNFENRYVRKDGQIVPMLWSAKWNEKEQVAFCIGRDFTILKKAEELQEFEKRDKEALINATDDLIWSVSKNFKLIAGNTAFINAIYKLTGQEIKTGDYLLNKDFFGEEIAQFWEQRYLRVLNGDAFIEEIFTDGDNPSWSEVNFQPIINSEKSIVGIACFARNITESKANKQKLDAERSILRSVIDNLPDYVFIKDINHKYVVANKGTLHLLNADSEESVVGKTIHDFLPKQVANQFIKGELAVLKKGITMSNYVQKIDPHNNQDATWKLITKVPLKDAHGKITGLVGITRDVTSLQKEQESQLVTHEIINALGIHEKIEDALAAALKIIGTYFNFNVGEAWLLNKEENKLEFTANWVKSKNEAAFFSDYSQFFDLGEGHPGKTWQMKRLYILNDIQQNKIRRVELAKEANLNACIGVPILFKGEVIAVFTFISEKYINENASFVSALNKIAVQIALDIERKKSERELFRYSTQIANILESITDGFMTIDKKWMVRYWNKEAEILIGILRKEVIGKPVWNAFPQEIILSLSDNVIKAMQVGLSSTKELYSDSMDKWFDIHVYPSQDGVSIFFKDISESKRQENLNLLEREVLELYTQEKSTVEEIIAHLLEGIEKIHPDMMSSVVRIKDNQMFHWVSKKLPQQYADILQRIPIGYAQGSCGTAAYLKESVIVSDIENDPLWANSKQYPLSYGLKACWSYPIIDSNNQVLATFGIYYNTIKHPKNAELLTIERGKNILKNIIENIFAKEAILLSNERYNIVAEATNDIIWDYNFRTDITSWNNVLVKILGYSEIETLDSWWIEKIHPEDKERVLTKLSEHIHFGIQDWTDEYRFMNHSGEYRYFQDKGQIIFDNHQEPIRMIGAMQDITLLKENEYTLTQLNIALEKRAEELATSNTELERFAYIASHDLQEPLRMVSSFLQLLQKKYAPNLDSKANEYIHFAVDGAERMKRLIMDMLEYSRVNTTKDSRAEVDMMQVMRDVKFNLTHSIANEGAIIHFEGLPTIKAIRSQMTQLLQNLVGNAIKYKHPDQSPIIHVTAEEDEKEWRFSVKDNGIGIEEKFYEKIFIIFQRLHNKSAYSGTGIGLAICKKIVERHHGQISVTSVVGEGSMFTFSVSK